MPLISFQQRPVLLVCRNLLQDERGSLGKLDERALVVLGQ